MGGEDGLLGEVGVDAPILFFWNLSPIQLPDVEVNQWRHLSPEAQVRVPGVQNGVQDMSWVAGPRTCLQEPPECEAVLLRGRPGPACTGPTAYSARLAQGSIHA